MMFAIIIFVVIAALLAGFGQTFVKKGLNEVGSFGLVELFQNFFKIFFNKYVLLGLSMYVVATLFFFVALSRGSLNLVFPLVSLSYVFAALFSIVILKESVSAIRWFGIAVIVLGCVFVGMG